MILLFGGTSETLPITEGLANAMVPTLVSTATSAPLAIAQSPWIHHRHGRLTATAMIDVIRSHGITCLVDASHPFASVLHQTAQLVADTIGIPYLRYERPSSAIAHAHLVPDHTSAAILACSFNRPILLTTGSKNLAEYTTLAAQHKIPIYARILDLPESIDACTHAGLHPHQCIFARGPFSIDENRSLLRALAIGVLVTKDSGTIGGVDTKLEAARLEQCESIMVKRPLCSQSNIGTISELIHHIKNHQPRSTS